MVLQTASGCNTHAFTAASSCAVLDLLPPPYNPRDRARPTSVLVEAGGRALASSANSTFARRPYHRVVVKGRRCRCWWWSAGAAAACSREGGERAAAGSRAGITL